MIAFDEIVRFAKSRLKDDTTGHDFWHGQRVARLGQRLYQADCEKQQVRPDPETRDLIHVAGLVHDTIDEKICSDPEATLEALKHTLEHAGLTSAQEADVVMTITHMSYSKNIKQRQSLSLSGKYVQDADRLEALGAIGIARAFTYGGRVGNKIYDPEIRPVKLVSHEQYRHHESTTLNHFDEKLFHLEALMNTSSGKHLAHERTLYLKAYVARFKEEWDGTDFNPDK